MLFDSHAHLESPRFEGDSAGVIARAREAGVTRILTCGSDLASSATNVEIAAANPGVYAAAGVHPHEANSLCGDAVESAVRVRTLDAFRIWALGGDIVAIGEIGLDYHYDLAPREVQQCALALQLELAAEVDLPVILHNRESDVDLMRIVDGAPQGLRGVLHCFMGDGALAAWALARGLSVGVAGPVTFRKMEGLLAVLSEIPLDRLLIETDSPYLAPHPHRGQRNEPALVVHVAERLAGLRGLSFGELAEITTGNACRLLSVS